MKTIDNEEQILYFLNSIKNEPLDEEDSLFFKKELTEVVFKPRSKRKRDAFCKQMDMDVFDEILKSLGVPFLIKEVKEESASYYIVKPKEEK